MDNSFLISEYKITLGKRTGIYSVGPSLFFYRPCIGYVKKGHAKFLYKGKTLYANPGDLIYISSKTMYQSIWLGSPDIEWYYIDFEFSSKHAFGDYQFQILKSYSTDLFEKMYLSYENSPMLCISYFYELLDDIYKKLERSYSTASYNNVASAIEYIEANYNKKISVNTLAELCHSSQSGLFKLFKKATGVSPITYKHNIMIQHAISLITSTDMSIEEISEKVGFSSSNYFRKIFIKLTKKTPKQLRKGGVKKFN